MTSNPTILEAALNELGPCLSTELSGHLMHRHGLTPAAARKRVSRSAPGVRRLAYLTFARSARFTYLQRQFGSGEYRSNLYAAIRNAKGPYARALSAVRARTAIPVEHFRAACGAPIRQRGQVSADAVCERLIKAGVLAKIDLPGVGPSITTRQTADSYATSPEQLAAQTTARLVAESAILGSVSEWARNLAFASYGKVTSRHGSDEPLPTVGPFAWDITAPSYLSVTSTWQAGKPKPGWFVCDVLLGRDVSLDGVEPFLNKVRSINALHRIGRTLFVFVARSYAPDALKALRSAGAVPATLPSLFGKTVAAAFADLPMLLFNANGGALDTKALEATISSLQSFDGAVGNMRGALFEFLVAELVRKRSPAQVQLRKLCHGDDGDAEVDVWELKDDVVARFIECKGVLPGHLVDDEEVKRWLRVGINRIRQHLQREGHRHGPQPVFELWTSGRLSSEAFDLLTRTKDANKRKFGLKLVLPKAIRAKAREANDPALLTLIENHFLPKPRREHS